MFAVKDHTKSKNSRVEADEKIGEVQRGHAQDGRRTKRGSKKKNVFDVLTQRGQQMEQISHCTWLSIILKKRKMTTTKCQQLKKKSAHLQPGNDYWCNGGAQVHHQTVSN